MGRVMTHAVALNRPQGAARELTLDFVKGILVTVMVLYHEMNVFTTADSAAYEPIRFVSGSFVLISGYIISKFYEDTFQADRFGTSRRLVVRGFKLLILFTVLNTLINLTGIGNPNKIQLGVQNYLSNLSAIYGSGDSKYASFQILLPISYLLIASPVFLLLGEIRKFTALASLTTALCASFFGIESINFDFMVIGVIGLSFGMLMNKLENPFSIRSRPIIFGCLVICICLMGYLSINLMTYSIGIMIIIKLLYDFGKTVNSQNHLARAGMLFGQYSLVCYIAQIAFLQGLAKLLSRQKWGLGYETISIFFVTNVFLLALCLFLTYLRGRYRLIGKSYKFIFS